MVHSNGGQLLLIGALCLWLIAGTIFGETLSPFSRVIGSLVIGAAMSFAYWRCQNAKFSFASEMLLFLILLFSTIMTLLLFLLAEGEVLPGTNGLYGSGTFIWLGYNFLPMLALLTLTIASHLIFRLREEPKP